MTTKRGRPQKSSERSVGEVGGDPSVGSSNAVREDDDGQVAAGLGSGYAHLDINGPVRGWEHDGAERQRIGWGSGEGIVAAAPDLGVVVGHHWRWLS